MKWNSLKALAASTVLMSGMAFAGPDLGAAEQQPTNWPAIIMFLIFVGATLFITKWAAKQTTSTKDFYTAGGGISGFQNGLAIAGDYMSAASFLGISAMVFMSGFDGLLYSLGFMVGWPIVLFLIAERLRNLGKYNLSDVVSFRLEEKPVRTLAALSSLVVVAFYLIAQMVGAGQLIKLLFGLNYNIAVVIVGLLMMAYVIFGGMLATTWVQIIKAVLLLSGVSFMAIMVLYHFDFSFESLAVKAVENHKSGEAILSPGGFITDPISAISLGMALMLGTAGLPHVLMRFFTVGNAKEARKSVVYATGFVAYFWVIITVVGFGAIAFLNSPEGAGYFVDGKLFGGSNMASVHLSHMLGGNAFLGFISAVAFATILAVVSGLTLAGASAISHDIYANVINPNASDEQIVRLSKITVILVGIIGVTLGIAFESQNIAYMVGLAFGIAASANFPILFLSIYWSKLTTRGAFIGGFIGLLTAIILVVLSPTVWVDIMKNPTAIFPYKHPALFSVSAAFIAIWFFSITDKSERAAKEIEAFEPQNVRAETGIGADGAVAH